MDLSYQQSQPYQFYEHNHWSEDFKPSGLGENEQGHRRKEGPRASATPVDFGAPSHSRRPSMLKVEDDYPTNEQSWHGRRHEPHHSMRHYSHPIMPAAHTLGQHQPYMRIDPNFAASYAHPQQWSVPQSGTSTPTPAYGGVDSYGHPVQYVGHHGFNFNQDPISAVSMSPSQSSQGGWASATSTDSTEQQAAMLQSPMYRPVSPQLVLRPDGIRKKNARFEIPKERNLQTIDALIQASTDDNEKKELKQQKRLLRNRQAAYVIRVAANPVRANFLTSLDSRQRKKSHTEKLEQEKKVTEKRMTDLEDGYTHMQDTLQLEREQWMQQRQHYEIQAKQLIHERDEAIRAKTVEAADYRRQLNALKDYVREHHLDRPHRIGGYAPASDMNNMASEFNDFNFDDEWENEFSLIGTDDLRMEELDSMQRQATPKPPAPSTTTSNSKTDANFSWNAFYMCLLFGAVVISAGEQLSKFAPKSSQISSLPKITDEYRVDAENVLKAVMETNPLSAHAIIPSRSAASTAPRTIVSGSEFSQMVTTTKETSGLDSLSSTLTTPSHQQQLQQIFSMPPASYNHIVDPLGEFDDDADADLSDSPKPTRLEQALAALQAQKAEHEKATGLRSKADERSVLLDHVPEEVIRDFQEFVRQSKALE